MNSLKNVWVAIAVVAVLAITGLFTPVGQKAAASLGFGAQTNFTDVKVSSSFQWGTSGTQFARLNSGTCSLTGIQVGTSTLATSTVGFYSCAATGVEPTDLVQADMQFASSTATTTGQWTIVGSSASSTAGYINVLLYNISSTTTIPSNVANNIGYIVLGTAQ